MVGNIRGGQMTPLVMLNNIKSPNFPEVPLFADVGYHGPPSRSWYGIFAPAGTPKAVIDRVSKDIGEVINRPEFSDRHLKAREPGAGREYAGAVRRRHQARARHRREGGEGRGV